MAATEATIQLGVDSAKALSSIDQFVRSAKSQLGDFQRAAKGLEGALDGVKKIAVAAVAVFAGKQVFDFFKEGIDSAIAQEQAMARLTAQLKLTGDFSEEAAASFAAFADEMEATSKHGDDVVLTQVAVAKSFGVSNEKAKELVTAAVELSAATGQDLNSSVQALGKTVSGVTGKLDEQVPALKNLTKEQLRAGDAIGIVLDRFRGSAAAEIQTFSGALLQTSNAFGNLKEAIGKVIIENGTLVEAAKQIGNAFRVMQGGIEKGSDGFSGAITTSVKMIAVAVPSVIEVLEKLATGFKYVALTGTLAFGGLSELGLTTARILSTSFVTVTSNIVTFVETLVRASKLIPGFGTAMGALGFDVDEAANAIGSLRQAAAAMADTGVAKVEGFAQSAAAASQTVASGFDTVIGSLADARDGADAAAQAIFDAETKVASGARTAAASTQALAGAATTSAEELKKLQAEAAKLANEIASEAEKVKLKLEEQHAKITELEQKRVISAVDAATLRADAEANAAAKILEINAKLNKELEEQRKKALSEFRADMEKTAARPITAVLPETKFDPRTLSAGQQTAATGVAAGLGVAANVLDGKEGAKNFLSQGIGAAADAFLPGIGGAVASIVGKLAEGPEAAKSFVTDFVEAIPDFITAIAESAPVVVEALVETLIVKGGIIRIATALARALVGEALFKRLGKQWGIQVGDAFNASKIGGTLAAGFAKVGPKLAEAFRATLPDFGGMFKAGVEAAIGPLRALFKGDLKGALTAAFNGPLEILKSSLPGVIRKPFGEAITRLQQAHTAGLERLQSFVASAPAKLSAGFRELVKQLRFISIELPRQLPGMLIRAAGQLTAASIRFVRESTQKSVELTRQAIVQFATAVPQAFQRGADFVRQSTLQSIELTRRAGQALVTAIPLAFQRAVAFVQQSTQRSVELTREAAAKLVEAIRDGATRAFEALQAGFQQALDGAGAALAGVWEGIRSGIADAFGAVGAELQATFGDIGTAIQESFASVAGEVAATIGAPIQSFLAFEFPSLPEFAFPEIPTPAWLVQFQDTVNKLVGFELPGAGGAVGGGKKGPVTGIKGSPLAKGGLIPPGFPNDTFPARMTSGELAIPPGPVDQLVRFLDDQERGGNKLLAGLLAQILAAVSQPVTAKATAELNGRALADIILQLDRRGARLSA